MTLALKAILSLDAKGFAQAAAASGERLRDLKGTADLAAAGMVTLATASDRATQSQAVAAAADQKRATAQQQLVQAQREVTAAQAVLSQVNDDAAAMAQQLADADQRRRQALDQVAAAQADVTAAQARLTAANDEAEQVHRALIDAEQARRQALEGLARIQIQSAAAAQREVEVLDLMRDAVRNATTADLARAQALEARIRQARDGAVAELQVARAAAQATGDYRAMAEAARNLQGVQGQLTAVQTAQAAIVRQIRDQYVPLEVATRQYEAALKELDAAERAGILTDKEAAAARAQVSASLRQAEEAHRRQTDAANAGGQSTRLAAHEVTNLSYQLQDAAVQLAGGQNPFLILMQQGPQAAGAVGGVSRLLSLMMSPALLATTAVVALGVGFAAAAGYISELAAETRSYETRLKALNPQIDLSVQKYRALAKEIAAAKGVSNADAATAIQRIVVVPTIRSTDLVRDLAGLSQDIAAVLGQDVGEWAEKLAKSFGKGAAGVRELDGQLSFLTASQAASIRALEAQGKQTEALSVAIAALEGRFGGAARKMQSEYAQAMTTMGNAWDDFLKRVFDEDVQKRAANVANAIANAIKAMAPSTEAEKNLARLIETQKQLTEKSSQLQAARDRGAVGPAVEVLQGQVDTLIGQLEALQRLVAANPVEKLSNAAAEPPAAAIPSGAFTPEEQKRINEAKVALDRYREGLQGVGLARQLAAAGAQAYYAEIEKGGRTEAAERQRQIAQQQVLADHDAAMRDLALTSRLAADAQDRLADAAGKGEAAQRAANDANEVAAATARSAAEGALVAAANKQKEAAIVKQASAAAVADLTRQTAANDRMSSAVIAGTAAVREAQREEYRLALIRERGAAAVEEIAAQMAAYDEALRSTDRLDWAEATADQARELGEVNSLLTVERANLTSSNRQRQFAIAHQQSLNELARIGVGWTEAERAAWLANADAIAAARGEAEELSRLRTIIEDVSTDAADATYEAMTGRGDSILRWFKDLWKRIAVEALKQQIILPIVTQIVGGAPGLFSQGGGSGVASSLSLGGVSAGGSSGMGGLGGLSLSLSQSMQDDIWAFAFNDLGLSSGLSDTIAGGLGSAGWGTIGVMGANLLGLGKGKYSQLGGLAGSVAGAIGGQALGTILGMAGGPIGAILGGFAGTALASLIGGKPSDKEGNAVIYLDSGSYQVGGFTGKKYSQENRDTAAGFADQALSIQKLLEQTFNARLGGTIAVGAGDRDGLFATYLNSTSRRNFDATEAGAEQLVSFVTQQFVAGIRDQLAPEISAALGRVDFTDLDKAAGDMDFIVQFRDSLKALRGDFGLTDQVTAQASAEVKAQTDAIKEFRETTARLFPDAVGEADAAIRQYVDGLIGVRDAAQPPTEIEQALSALQATWEAYIPLMEQVGYTTAEAQEKMASGLAKAKEAAKADWVGQMDREFNDLIGNSFINQLRDLKSSRDTQYRNADALGVDRGIVDRNVGAALGGIVTADLRSDQLQEIIRLFGTDFPEAAGAAQTALDKLTGAVTDTGQAAADAAAELAARTGQAMDALADRMARATGASETLEGALASFDRAAAQERTATQARITAGEIGAGVLTETETTLAAERAAIIKKFADAAVAEEQRRAQVTRSLEDRAFALSVRGQTDASVQTLYRQQQAEFAAAVAAGYTAEQLDLLVKVLGGEMVDAVNAVNKASTEAADAALAAAKAVNDNFADRLFTATTDTSTLAGALAAFDRQAAKDRIEAAKTAGANIAQLEEAQGIERAAIIKKFGDAAAQALAAVNTSIADRLFAATNDNSTLEGALAAFDRQAAKDRIEAAKTAGADMVGLEQAIAAERGAIIKRFAQVSIDAEKQRLEALAQAGGGLRQWIDGVRATVGTSDQNLATVRAQFTQQLGRAQAGDVDAVQGLREYAQRLIDAETARTASGADRRAMVEAILTQVEALPAVKSWDAQQLEMLTAIRTETVNNRGAFAAAVAALPPAATGGQIAAALLPHFQTLDQSLDGLITPAEFRAAIGGLATDAVVDRWFRELDQNGDGMITQQELTTRAANNLSGGGGGTLQAISDLTYAGNRDRIDIGNALGKIIADGLTALGTLQYDGNVRLSNLHTWMTQVWAVESKLLDRTTYNTAETAKKLGGGYAYAGGTDFHPGGWALVGEEGPEYVHLPRAAQVFTRDQSLELARRPRSVVVGVTGGGGDNAALTAAIERQARATERQNALLEKIAAATGDGATAAAQTAAALKKPARVKVGNVAKLRRDAA